MMKQRELIVDFVKDAEYYSIVYYSGNDTDFGKIIEKEELLHLDLKDNEIRRSIEYKNGDRLFVVDFSDTNNRFIDSSLQLILNTLNKARAIEDVYQNIFTWVFDGVSIKGYAIVPSGKPTAHPTISRYGGTENFIRILRQHLKNIAKMKMGGVPDYNFLNLTDKIVNEEISIGSYNKKHGNYSVIIDTSMDWRTITRNSNKCISKDIDISKLDMKYWAKEINPDFISEAKHIKLNNPLPVKGINEYEIFALYPAPIKRLMEMKDKGNYNRFLLARFLLSVHAPDDAKHMYYTILGQNPKELEHVKSGNCSTQWNYVINNLKKYDCPSMKELSSFIRKGDEAISHPLEKIQEFIENQKNKEEEE